MPDPDSSDSARRANRTMLVVVVASIAAILLAGMTMLVGPSESQGSANEKASSQQSAGPGSGASPDPATREKGDPLAKGDVDAPVVLVDFSDFQCPFCRTFALQRAPQLQHYIDEGILRVEWRDFPYFGEESTTSARAARAAGQQGKFWEYHDRLFEDAGAPNSGTFSQDYLVQTAKDLDLDISQFRTDMRAKSTDKAIKADLDKGQSLGISGTPTFFVNGDLIVGAQPLEAFEQAIEEAAAEAKD